MAKELTIKEEQSWYQLLLADLRKLEFTGIVLTKHAIGKRIIEDELKFGKPEYGSKRIENLAKDCGVGAREVYFCVQFATKYPDIDPLDQNWAKLSWRYITRGLLPNPRPKPEMLPLPDGKYNIIYADPPWQFDNSGFSQSAGQQYPTMATEEISKLPISEKTYAGSVLFLWATNAMLEDALQVMKEWGFKYKSNMIWAKNRGPGIGWFVDSRHEILLIGTKGANVHPAFKPASWFQADVTKHSKKPELVYGLIEKMYKGPYLEMFARNKRDGWMSWGNEL